MDLAKCCNLNDMKQNRTENLTKFSPTLSYALAEHFCNKGLQNVCLCVCARVAANDPKHHTVQKIQELS